MTPHTVAEARIFKGLPFESPLSREQPVVGLVAHTSRALYDSPTWPAPLPPGYEAGLDIHAPTTEHQPHLSWRPDDAVTPDGLAKLVCLFSPPQCGSAPQEEAQLLAAAEAEAEDEAETTEDERMERAEAGADEEDEAEAAEAAAQARRCLRSPGDARGGGCAPPGLTPAASSHAPAPPRAAAALQYVYVHGAYDALKAEVPGLAFAVNLTHKNLKARLDTLLDRGVEDGLQEALAPAALRATGLFRGQTQLLPADLADSGVRSIVLGHEPVSFYTRTPPRGRGEEPWVYLICLLIITTAAGDTVRLRLKESGNKPYHIQRGGGARPAKRLRRG